MQAVDFHDIGYFMGESCYPFGTTQGVQCGTAASNTTLIQQ